MEGMEPDLNVLGRQHSICPDHSIGTAAGQRRAREGSMLLVLNQVLPMAFWMAQDCPPCRSFSACRYGRQVHRH